MLDKVLTVIVPSYNVEAYLPETIPTFLRNEVLSKVEVLIVNDGSKDRTAEIGKQFEKQYPDTVKLVNKENGGHGSTINKGIQLAKGKYVKVVDADDWVDPEEFVKYVNELENIDVDVILTPFIRVNIDTNQRERKDFDNIEPEKIYDMDEVLKCLKDSYQMHSVTFNLRVLKNMRQIDEHCFYVDQEYILFPFNSVCKLEYLNIPIYQYRVGNQEQSVSIKNMQKNRQMHKKVIDSLLDERKQHTYTEEKTDFIDYRIQNLCRRQIDIYFSMGKNKNIKQELFSFLGDIKEKDIEIYKNIPGKKAAFLRRFGIAFYYIYFLLRGNTNEK